MTHYLKIADIEDYPDVYISRGRIKAIKKDGLIEPILMLSKTKVHPESQERFMTFKKLAAEIEGGATTIIACFWDELSKEEKLEYPVRK